MASNPKPASPSGQRPPTPQTPVRQRYQLGQPQGKSPKSPV